MASEYNSKLIDNLYQTRDEEEAERILEEMEEIADPVFIRPIVAAYRKFQYASNSHYFVATLNKIESRGVLEALIEIVSDQNVKSLIYTYALEGLTKYEHFEPKVVFGAKLILYGFSTNRTNIHLENLLEYLKKAGILPEFENELKTIFEEDKFDSKEKSTALGYLLNLDPKKWLQFYIDNQARISNKPAEVILSKTLTQWKGTLVEKLKDKIISSGGVRAKEIIESSRARKLKEVEEKERKETSSHPNIRIVVEIIELREKINILSNTEPNIGFDFFPKRESIYKQLEAATTETDLRSACLELRELFQDIDKRVGGHGIEFEQGIKILPGLLEQDFNKSLNQLHLFLYSKGIKVSTDLFGLKTLQRLVSLIAHPDAKNDLLDLLKKINIAENYKKEDWVFVHRYILDRYLEFLKKLRDELLNFSKKPPTETGQPTA